MMQTKTAVSIVMPIYNVSRFLEQSLGGLLKQTLKNIEIICVNDGSTDNSLNIVNYYAREDKRIKIVDGTNHGYGYAMNRGFELANGEYIGILEPDDYADNEMFESLYKIAKQNDLDVVKSNYYIYREKIGTNVFEEVLIDRPYNKVTSIIEDPSIVTLRPCIWSAIYKREFILKNNIKFNETPGASYQDTAFSFKTLMYANRIMFIKEPYLHYRFDNEDSSVNSSGKVFSVCDEFDSIQAELNENADFKNRLIKPLQALKANTYAWNEGRLSDEYKKMFRDRAALEFIKAEYDGCLDRETLNDFQWNYIQTAIDEYKDKQNYNPNMFREFEIMRNSHSYKIGHILMFIPGLIKRKIFKKY